MCEWVYCGMCIENVHCLNGELWLDCVMMRCNSFDYRVTIKTNKKEVRLPPGGSFWGLQKTSILFPATTPNVCRCCAATVFLCLCGDFDRKLEFISENNFIQKLSKLEYVIFCRLKWIWRAEGTKVCTVLVGFWDVFLIIILKCSSDWKILLFWVSSDAWM